ncbi:hypothetical protein BABINDRAFT_19359, partial [Babjeviella inositovora NRRL Y-12698]
LLYRNVKAVKVGQIERFHLTYTPDDATRPLTSLWLKVKNTEMLALRAAYLAGPYTLYVDVRSSEYDQDQTTFITADQPIFEPELTAGRAFYAELSMRTLKPRYEWIVDVMSQVIFNPATSVNFEIQVGTSREVLSHGWESHKIGGLDTRLSVVNQDTLDLWNIPKPIKDKPVHLVVLTHGLHSNIGTDMFYLKEAVEKHTQSNVMVRGFHGNACKTERGIKYLGSRVAEFVMEVYLQEPSITQVSFIGHSLGGVVQTFAIAYLESNFPSFFKQVQPVNFITLASPMLGIASENPAFITMALTAGVVGKTGHDLGLKYVDGHKPLLLLLPTGPTHKILKRFERRTVYANASNDGIVPIRTSALLYLDYKGLAGVEMVAKKYASKEEERENHTHAIASGSDIGQIPISAESGIAATTKSFFSGTPLQNALSFFMPQAQKRPANSGFAKFQTVDKEADPTQKADSDEGISESLSKTSMIGSAAALILPPMPSVKFINDPQSREPVIFHDRVYQSSDLPPQEKRETSFIQSIDPFYSIAAMEEEIARAYHKEMAWRKVLVNLKPDAHNNIIVRRRFANAYGWPVIDHLIANHFGSGNTERASSLPRFSPDRFGPVKSTEFSFKDLSLFNDILSRDRIIEENEMEDDLGSLTDVASTVTSLRTAEDDERWINFLGNAESIFAVGPTGMISNVGEFVENFRTNLQNFATNN